MRVTGSRAWFDEYNNRDSLQARAIEGIVYYVKVQQFIVLILQKLSLLKKHNAQWLLKYVSRLGGSKSKKSPV